MKLLSILLTLIVSLLAAEARAAALKPELSGISFLVGSWSGDKGKVADTGGTSAGISHFTAEADGAVLLRRDSTKLLNAAGKPTGGFDQIMMIYFETGQLRAEYAGSGHLIHYTNAVVEPGKSVTFTSTAQAGEPNFRLSYQLTEPGMLSVSFSMSPPGGSDFHPIAVGTLKKAR